VCIAQPSFEGTPATVLYGIASVQPPWATCYTLQDAAYSADLPSRAAIAIDNIRIEPGCGGPRP
jgi:hypothetical protein